ncbi:hypothetical protein QBC35DRAFT_115974 [Podospora australis]|uniref:Uncharacterized protein n=1 Tax=Podospora australis TaxID=1536484 RepID=A0AAN7ADM0_9PEZI|nr:hypothetical protein QBC35DRAFT_115974 [Podospora australis]
MERDGKDQPSLNKNSQAAPTHGRAMSTLSITSASKRQSLFGRPRGTEEATRPTSAGWPSDTGAASTNTRIPRLAQQSRSFSITDAYHLAKEEEAAAQGSPSPAPRSWRNSLKLSSAGPPGSQPRRGLSGKSTESLPGDLAGSTGSLGAQSQQSDSSFDDKIRQHGLTQGIPETSVRSSSSVFLKSGIGPKIIETGNRMVRRTSRNSLDGHSSPQSANTTSTNTRFSRLLSGKKRGLNSSVTATQTPAGGIDVGEGSSGEPLQSSTDLPLHPHTGLSTAGSPEKSFAWEAEANFTAGDLQVSNSPPLHISRSNTKLDEIRALEDGNRDNTDELVQNELPNTRIDEIRTLEEEAALRFPEQDVKPEESKHTTRSRSGSRASAGSAGVDRLRELENENLSGRALATAGLGELRGRNVEHSSHSRSPEVAQRGTNEHRVAFNSIRDRDQRRDSDAGRVGPETRELTTYQDTAVKPPTKDDMSGHDPVDGATQRFFKASEKASRGRDGSRDVLRRLSVATNTGPILEPPTGVSQGSDVSRARDRDATASNRVRRLLSARSDGKPTVGFAGLRRSDSVESGLTKRSSLMQSESDPTERIEGEMNLFAPLENQSERGSLRAPSPDSEGEIPDKTPRPVKLDPLALPTPRVTGAFVETPATVKVERLEDSAVAASEDSLHAGKHVTQSILGSGIAPRGSSIPREAKQTQSIKGDRASRRSSLLAARRRTRSLSRGRSLINSAKPPTVKDDLLEIQRVNQIEDSTLDDIADLFIQDNRSGSGHDSGGFRHENAGEVEIKTEHDIEAIDRMGRSLKQASASIRSAKKGIERLEHQFATPNQKKHSQQDTTETGILSNHPVNNSTQTGQRHKTEVTECSICRDSGSPVSESITYVHLPIPRLWYRQPKFRFTPLGLGLFLLSLWYIVESWMCYLYCKPLFCSAGLACRWNSDYPTWGYAIPIKLDEWTTGGQGRALVQEFTPDVVDWFADIWDTATGTDPLKVDTSDWSWAKKRRHRRRLTKRGLIQPVRDLPSEGLNEPVYTGEVI